MSRRDQLIAIVFLLVAQAVCLAVGFWTLHRSGISLVAQAGREEAWSDLAELAQEIAVPLESMNSQNGLLQADLQRIGRIVSEEAVGLTGQAVLVDKQWRVLVGHRGAENESRLRWSPLDKPMESTRGTARGALFRGNLTMPDGQHIGVARPLPTLDGYLVVHRWADELSVRPDSMARCLFYAGLIAFAGTTGLSSFVAYLVFAHLCERFSHRLSESEADGRKKTESLLRMRDAVIFGLADLTESRDSETGHHLERISIYASVLARALRRHPTFRAAISPDFVNTIGLSAILHDVGKVGVEDAVLLKPGRLSDDEFQRMQRHATVGGECLAKVEQRLGSANFLRTAREVAYGHHERWDGGGYPQGVAGEEIPLAARIVAICDVYEALSGKRVYKQAWPHERCVAHIRSEAGKHFDPQMVEVFLQIESQFLSIARQYRDDPLASHESGQDKPSADSQQSQHEIAFAETSPAADEAGSASEGLGA